METKIQKWGNSLAVRLPREVTKKFASLREGSPVVVTEERARIVVKPLLRGRATLKELVGRITPENLHAEADWGDARAAKKRGEALALHSGSRRSDMA